jgi:hypothetical protein
MEQDSRLSGKFVIGRGEFLLRASPAGREALFFKARELTTQSMVLLVYSYYYQHPLNITAGWSLIFRLPAAAASLGYAATTYRSSGSSSLKCLCQAVYSL